MSRVRQKQLSTVGMLSAYPGSCSVPPHVNMDNTTQLHQTEHQLALIKAFESAWQKPHSSRHTARMWSALGLGKCSCQSSVMVRRRALALLLEHGVLGHESLSVCEL